MSTSSGVSLGAVRFGAAAAAAAATASPPSDDEAAIATAASSSSSSASESEALGGGVSRRPASNKESVAYLKSKASEKEAIVDDPAARARRWTTIGDNNKLKMANLRRELMDELLTTERQYVRDLHILIEIFMEPMLQREIITRQQAALLFSNLTSLIPINISMLAELEKNTKPLGTVILEEVNKFKLYAIYCSNHGNVRNRIAELREGNQKFSKFLNRCFFRPECRKLDLEAFLIMPMQRLCRYPLFLKEIIKNTPPDDPELPNLLEALNRFRDVIELVNERAKRVADVEALIELETLITYSEKLESFELLVMGRRLVHKGQLLCRKQKTDFAVLCNDILALCRTIEREDEQNYLMTRVLDLDKLSVLAANDPNSPSIHIYDASRQHSWEFEVETTLDKNKWIKELTNTIASAERTAIDASMAASSSSPSIKSSKPKSFKSPPTSPRGPPSPLPSSGSSSPSSSSAAGWSSGSPSQLSMSADDTGDKRSSKQKARLSIRSRSLLGVVDRLSTTLSSKPDNSAAGVEALERKMQSQIERHRELHDKLVNELYKRRETEGKLSAETERAAKLEQENKELRAKVAALEAQLSQYQSQSQSQSQPSSVPSATGAAPVWSVSHKSSPSAASTQESPAGMTPSTGRGEYLLLPGDSLEDEDLAFAANVDDDAPIAEDDDLVLELGIEETVVETRE